MAMQMISNIARSHARNGTFMSDICKHIHCIVYRCVHMTLAKTVALTLHQAVYTVYMPLSYAPSCAPDEH